MTVLETMQELWKSLGSYCDRAAMQMCLGGLCVVVGGGRKG